VTSMSTVVGVSMLAHGLHYAMVLLGLWGLAALLLPHTLDRLVPGPSNGRHSPRDEHEVRVAALRTAVASGSPGIPTVALGAPGVQEAGRRDLAAPLLVVASTAAAGIHAAVAPAHLREQVLFGAFFMLVACAQVAWSAALLHQPQRAVLVAGVVGNSALLALWLVTRIVGLPFGLMPDPHPLGGWDLVCAAWEVTVVVTCVRLLRARADDVPGCPGWFDWHPAARAATGAAAVTLVLLTLIGAHS